MSKKDKTLIMIIFLMCIVGLMLTIVDYMALTDIRHEYVGTNIRGHIDMSQLSSLAEWTSNKPEWLLVGISHFFRVAFFVFCVVVLSRLLSRMKNKETG